MKQRWMLALVSVAMVALWSVSAYAQFGRVSGICRDADGNPIAGATVRYVSKDTGQKFEMKTGKKGDYNSIGVAAGHAYTVYLIGADGKEIQHVDNVQVSFGDNTPLDFDIKQQQTKVLQQQGMTAEQAKEAQAQLKEKQAAAAKESDTIKVLNEKLTAANEATKTGNYDSAISLLTEATNLDATRDVLWYRLGDAYSQSATKQTDSSEKSKRLDSAIADIQKAIDIKKADMASANSSDKKPDAAKEAESNKNLAAYYNGLGSAYARAGKADGAVTAYNQAADLDPTNRGMYYFNLGAIMTNGGHVDEAIAAFDKAIAADPTKAAAYYWKGVNLMGKATLKGDKMIAPEGTTEALNKYLELEPTGQYAQPAKDLLASMGASVETSYGKKKGASPKK
jgi:tetratricopeptide (TPR) repeat protein